MRSGNNRLCHSHRNQSRRLHRGLDGRAVCILDRRISRIWGALAGGASVTVSLSLGAGLGTQSTHQGSLALADDGFALEISASVELATRLVSGGSTVYVGGGFRYACGANSSNSCIDVPGLVGWDGVNSTWNALGSGGVGVSETVRAIALDESSGSLYVGGIFTSVWGGRHLIDVERSRRWRVRTWHQNRVCPRSGCVEWVHVCRGPIQLSWEP